MEVQIEKNSENVISNWKVDQGLQLKSSRDVLMLNIIRIFGVEAVWKQPNLPPHLSSIYLSDSYKANFYSVEGGGKTKKIFSKEKNIVYLNFMKGT